MNNDSPHDILLLLGRIEGKLDAVIKRMDKMDSTIDNHEHRIGGIEGAVKNIDKQDAAIESHEQRISTLEKAHARFKGGTALLVALVSAVTAIAAILLRLTNGK